MPGCFCVFSISLKLILELYALDCVQKLVPNTCAESEASHDDKENVSLFC